MKVHELFEKRSNPEMNPKQSLVDFLEPYKNRDDIYVHFTDIKKVGVNPKSQFFTPSGVYSYPLDIAWSKYDKLTKVPFAGNKKFVYILKQTKPVFEFSDYSSSKWEKDKSKLISLFKNKKFKINEDSEDWYEFSIYASHNMIDPEDFNPDSLSIQSLITIAEATRKLKTHSAKLWNTTKLISANGRSDPNPNIWNKVLRDIGYGAVSDRRGKGIIHSNEPIQTLFLTPDAYKIVDVLERFK